MSNYILIQILNQEDPAPLVHALHAELMGYFRSTGLAPEIDFTIETARTYDPLARPSEGGVEASSKQLNLMNWRVGLVVTALKRGIKDPLLNESAELINMVYDLANKTAKQGQPVSKSEASSLIDAANDLLEELKTVE